MKKRRIDHILWQVAEDVFGKLAFMFSFPDDAEGEPDEESPPVSTAVTFTGPFEGGLSLSISPWLLPELAGNMLGIDDEETTTEAEQMDALRELINVICGNLLPKIAGKKAIFKVGVPEIRKQAGAPGSEAETPVSRIRMVVEDGTCELSLNIRGDLPAFLLNEMPEETF